MVNNSSQHIKAMLDMLSDVAAKVRVLDNMSDAASIDAYTMDDYERVSCVFDDGMRITLTISMEEQDND